MNLRPVFPQDQTKDMLAWYNFLNSLNQAELNEIEELFNTHISHAGEIEGDDASYRNSQIAWVGLNNKTKWLYQKLTEMIAEANTQWGFELHSLTDDIQLTKYEAPSGHYGWHQDIGSGELSLRKISLVMQLSSPDEYEGGELQLNVGGRIVSCPRGLGDVIIFPSYMLHQVTPVTKGTRKSIVLWAGGEHYK